VTISFSRGASSPSKGTDLRVVRGHSSPRDLQLIAYTPAGSDFIEDYLHGHDVIPSQCADEVIAEAGWQQLSIV